MKYHPTRETTVYPQYVVDERAFVEPYRQITVLQRQYYLWKFFHPAKYSPNKIRCNTLLHGLSTPRG
jgi:hypothetical protein